LSIEAIRERQAATRDLYVNEEFIADGYPRSCTLAQNAPRYYHSVSGSFDDKHSI